MKNAQKKHENKTHTHTFKLDNKYMEILIDAAVHVTLKLNKFAKKQNRSTRIIKCVHFVCSLAAVFLWILFHSGDLLSYKLFPLLSAFELSWAELCMCSLFNYHYLVDPIWLMIIIKYSCDASF